MFLNNDHRDNLEPGVGFSRSNPWCECVRECEAGLCDAIKVQMIS